MIFPAGLTGQVPQVRMKSKGLRDYYWWYPPNKYVWDFARPTCPARRRLITRQRDAANTKPLHRMQTKSPTVARKSERVARVWGDYPNHYGNPVSVWWRGVQRADRRHTSGVKGTPGTIPLKRKERSTVSLNSQALRPASSSKASIPRVVKGVSSPSTYRRPWNSDVPRSYTYWEWETGTQVELPMPHYVTRKALVWMRPGFGLPNKDL